MKKRIKKPKVTDKQLGGNPFAGVDRLQILVRGVYSEDAFTKDGDGDWLPAEYDHEEVSFTKFFKSSDRRLEIGKLETCSKALLLWLMQTVEVGKDWVWINKERYMEEDGVSRNTYTKAVNDLIRNQLILPTVVRDVYWINPHYFFNGSRIRKYPKNLVIRRKRGKDGKG